MIGSFCTDVLDAQALATLISTTAIAKESDFKRAHSFAVTSKIIMIRSSRNVSAREKFRKYLTRSSSFNIDKCSEKQLDS